MPVRGYFCSESERLLYQVVHQKYFQDFHVKMRGTYYPKFVVFPMDTIPPRLHRDQFFASLHFIMETTISEWSEKTVCGKTAKLSISSNRHSLTIPKSFTELCQFLKVVKFPRESPDVRPFRILRFFPMRESIRFLPCVLTTLSQLSRGRNSVCSNPTPSKFGSISK